MTTSATIELLTIDEVVTALNVSKSTVEKWVKDKDLASFKKGKCRLISREDLTRFVNLNTVKPRRPDWLTAAVESDWAEKLKAIVRAEVRNQIAEIGQRERVLA